MRRSVVLFMLVTFLHVPLSSQATASSLAVLSLEELMKVEVTSVSKRPEQWSAAPAAVFVITRDDIRRSGVTSLPEALRLAPNLQVARINAGQYAISARGFNNTTANKLLVLIDGRSVYTPLYSGVFWEEQVVMLEDVERIEVISGPGGTLWGSNAVNGVINIITRDAWDTRCGLVTAGGGPVERGGSLRYGGEIGETAAYRVYATGFDRGETFRESGAGAHDSWSMAQGGFRTDVIGMSGAVTLQGDGYSGSGEDGFEEVSGGDLLARLTTVLDGGSAIKAQAYLDRRRHFISGTFGEVRETYDIDAQHSFGVGERHEIVWGGGYRQSRDVVTNSAFLSFLPTHAATRLSNVFLQDTVSLHDELHLTVGAKLEKNSYTNLETQPSARLAWRMSDRGLLWTAVARVVRTPSRIDRELYIASPAGSLDGGPGFHSEELIAYELGYRGRTPGDVWFSLSTFYNVYNELRSLEPVAGSQNRFVIGNKMEGDTWGGEIWGGRSFSDRLRMRGGYSYLKKRLRFETDSGDTRLSQAGNDPEHQFFLRAQTDPAPGVEFDIAARAISHLPDPRVPGYVAVDARAGWRVAHSVELSLTGTNLTDRGHPEFGAAPGRSEIARTFFARVQWDF